MGAVRFLLIKLQNSDECVGSLLEKNSRIRGRKVKGIKSGGVTLYRTLLHDDWEGKQRIVPIFRFGYPYNNGSFRCVE